MKKNEDGIYQGNLWCLKWSPNKVSLKKLYCDVSHENFRKSADVINYCILYNVYAGFFV